MNERVPRESGYAAAVVIFLVAFLIIGKGRPGVPFLGNPYGGQCCDPCCDCGCV